MGGRRNSDVHDILAAEAFEVPAADPELHAEPPHDVLAAEEFEMPARDASIHPDPVVLPEDPTGVAAPHDILAAEEFPLPWARSRGAGASRGGWGSRVLLGFGAVLVLGVLLRALRRKVTQP